MRRTGIALRRVACGLALLGLVGPLAGCAKNTPLVIVRLTATHPDAEAAREVWSRRFRDARARELLDIAWANAKLEAPGLVLEAAIRSSDCELRTIDEARLAVIDLATGHHVLTVHRVGVEAAEVLAKRLRAELGADVQTPNDLPGQIRVDQPPSAVRAVPVPSGFHLVMNAPVVHHELSALKHDEGHAAGQPIDLHPEPATTTAWVVMDTPIVDGTAVSTAAVQSDGARRALDIHFTPQGAATLAAISPELRGEPLVFVLDGELLIAPIVGSRLSERLGIELPAAMSERATALARAIAASNFASPPTPIEVSAQCERPR